MKGLFLFDNLTGHGAYREDALVSSRMNKKPGGKSSLMTGAWFIPDKNKPEERKDQCMQLFIEKLAFDGFYPVCQLVNEGDRTSYLEARRVCGREFLEFWQ